MSGSGAPRDPQELERLLIERQHRRDLDGMLALFEPDAVIDAGDRMMRGLAEIRAFYADLIAGGRKFQVGKQRPALLCCDLALTSTRLPDGSVTAEVARRQADGTWRWVIDRYSAA